ncbi:hypothetical protein RFZ51_10085, partial [Acinetobacter baumannii]|nr:hypothetical protein [Acinetobacter baumannii]
PDDMNPIEDEDEDEGDEVGINLSGRRQKAEQKSKRPGFMKRIFKSISSGLDTIYEGDDDDDENDNNQKK